MPPTPHLPSGSGWAHWFVRGCWLLALSYDLYTSFLGNRDIILGGSVEGAQYLILIGLTLLITASPMILALVWSKRLD